jgi:hypothetical protein
VREEQTRRETTGFDVSCVIPRWGRTFANVMRKIGPLSDRPADVERIIALVASGKELAVSDPIEAWERIRSLGCPHLSVAPDRKREERLYRPGFLGIDLSIDGIVLRVEGDEPHNGSSLIKLGEADFAIVGLDELLALSHRSLSDPRRVTKWGLYNYRLRKDSDLRIAGSANLTSFNETAQRAIVDFVGFFLISNCDAATFRPDWDLLTRQRMPVFVKGRYEELVKALLPGLNTVPTAHVEEAVMRQEVGIGVEIVQSGSTVREKGLRIYGSPLFLSESLYVADYGRYLSNMKLQKLLQRLKPLGYFDPERIDHYTNWFLALEENLEDSWVNRPHPESLFCSMAENRQGLRPYRLKTRRWMPSDEYKREEAEALVSESLHRIKERYSSGRKSSFLGGKAWQ